MTLFKSKIKGGKYNDNSTSWIRCGRCTRSTEYNTDTRNYVNVLFQKTQMKGEQKMLTVTVGSGSFMTGVLAVTIILG